MSIKDSAPGRGGYTEQQAKQKSKLLPFTLSDVLAIARGHSTPFYLYDEREIRSTAQRMTNAFSWVSGERGGFQNYYAVKALPNPHILSPLREEGMGADCSSPAELELAEMAGIVGEQVMFTSNNTRTKEFVQANRLGAIINVDDISHLPDLVDHVGVPPVISFRYNPGPQREGNAIIGTPEEAKFGMTKDQLFQAYEIMRGKGVRRFGLHTMVASNELDPQYFIDTAKMLFSLVGEIKEEKGIDMEFVNLGGGIGIPYRPEQQEVDLGIISQGIKEAYDEQIVGKGLDPLRVVMECGRYVTGPHGYLVTSVIHHNNKYQSFVGLDATIADLMRPGIYPDAYHHATVLGKEEEPYDTETNLTGSLCEGNDFLARGRLLPATDIEDIVVFHDAGAHARAMGFNYNGKLRPAEFLLQTDGTPRMIRRAETHQDLFATLNF
jgi:diaminopimelate decarboxylase